MPANPLYRFGVFEADTASGELRRKGVRVRLSAQPFSALIVLLEKPGSVVSREEIAQRLWPDGTFVDFEQGVNSAVNRVREALGDDAANPRFVETLAKRGYRFVAPVERIGPGAAVDTSVPPEPEPTMSAAIETATSDAATADDSYLASPSELPAVSPGYVRVLFLLLQVMYFGFYVGLLCNLPEVNEILSAVQHPEILFGIAVVTAAVLIPVRAYLLSGFSFRAPGMRARYLRLWPFLLVLDEAWALSPFLLIHHVGIGVALACTALLVYSPFAQRSLVLMGAGRSAETQAPTGAL